MALTASVGRWLFDYLALIAALFAVGATPSPSLVLLAFVGASMLGMVPFTPGGLGFVEAGLTGLLALAGVAGRRRGRRDARVPARVVLAPDPRRAGRVLALPAALPDLGLRLGIRRHLGHDQIRGVPRQPLLQ